MEETNDSTGTKRKLEETVENEAEKEADKEAKEIPKEDTEATPQNDERKEHESTPMEVDEEEKKEEPPKTEQGNAYDNLRWIVVRNDGKDASMIKLIGLKSLFSKQLPKMPRAYIARLVLDERHTSLAILSADESLKDTDEEIIGGICYRAFSDMRFAEIAFCAVNATHQVKGYGTKLMNLLKQLAVQTGIEYLITYADNYAIGYFKKQGFSKNISMPKGRYTGLIKEYDGGTPMECYVHPSVDYTRVPEMIAFQRKFIMDHVRSKFLSHKVYDALPIIPDNHNPLESIPGLDEAGWTLVDLLPPENDDKAMALKTDLLAALRRMEEQQYAWPFREPVDPAEVPDYLTVIKEPMDLSTMDKRVRADYYRTKDMFFADVRLIVENCKTYNEPDSTYVQCAKKLEKFMNDKLK